MVDRAVLRRGCGIGYSVRILSNWFDCSRRSACNAGLYTFTDHSANDATPTFGVHNEGWRRGIIAATIIHIKIEFDSAKDAGNSRKHGVSLARAAELDWSAARVEADDRFNYEEDRFIGYAPLGDRVYCVAFTDRGDAIRVISLRKANRREVQRYEQQA